MTIVRKISYQQIFLFDDTYLEKNFKNSLKEFIYYLRYTGIKGVIDFSFSSNSDTIHPKLSIKDNFILDSVPKSLIKNKEDNFRFRLTELSNSVLAELIENLEPIERTISELNCEEIKLASIIKSLLSHSEYLFLEYPDQYLSTKNLKLIKEALKYEVNTNNRKVFLKPFNNDAWIDIATDIITKNEKKEYIKSQNPLSSLNNKEESFKPTFNFTLHNKAS